MTRTVEADDFAMLEYFAFYFGVDMVDDNVVGGKKEQHCQFATDMSL